MAVWVCALLLASLADAATFNTKVSPVQKVIELLDDLKGKVQADLSAEETTMDAYTKWCDTEKNEKDDAVTSSSRTISELSASIEDDTGSISSLTSESDELASKISTSEAELASAQKIRDDERASFEDSEKELGETVDTLGRAVIVLKRGQTGFLQSKNGNKEMKMLITGLSKIVMASWVPEQQRAGLQALLQSEDEDLSLQPQATAAAFESKGGSILDLLDDLKEKAEDALSGERKTEMEAGHAFAMLKHSLEAEQAQMNKRRAQATNERSQTEEAMHAAAEDLEASKKSKATDVSYLAELKQSCTSKATEWSQRQKNAAEEMAVIEKAKEILSSGVKVFLQVTKAAKITKRASKDSEVMRDQVVKILRRVASKDHVYAMTQLAADASNDSFGKVRSLISNMVDRLMKEAAEEADAKAFCDTEISKSRSKSADLSAKVDMHSVRIEKATAAIAKLGEQTKAIQAEQAETDQAEAEAQQIRTAEKAEYEKSSAEFSQAVDAVQNAIQVLTAYYSQGSFVQTSQPEFGGSKSDVGSTIVSMLEVAEADFTKLLAEANTSENAAQTAFDKLQQKNSVSRAAKEADVKGKESEMKSLDMSLINYKEDRVSTGKELSSVMDYLDKLKPECETKVMTYADRKGARENEISGLKEALAILEG